MASTMPVVSSEACDSLAMKPDDSEYAEDSTDEDVVSLIDGDASGVSLVRHGVHGSTSLALLSFTSPVSLAHSALSSASYSR